MKSAKFIGKFIRTGYTYEMQTPGSAQITKIDDSDKYRFVELSVFDKTVNGTVLSYKRYDKNGENIHVIMGQIVKVRNQNGKVISRYLQFVDESDNGVSAWYVSQLNNKGYVTQYETYRVEAGTLGIVKPDQHPTIVQRTAVRVSKFPWE